MPHQCTNCGHVFPDGSKEMLSGCPDCGGNKFQFKPGTVDDFDRETEPPQRSEPDPRGSASPPAPPETEGSESDAEVLENGSPDDSSEDRAQATARSDVVTPSELTAVGSAGPQSSPRREPEADDAAAADARSESNGRVAETQSEERPNLDQLRAELNDQFESIKILNPGQYELNLMELYDRDEYIISLREDGRYVIEVPDAWGSIRED